MSKELNQAAVKLFESEVHQEFQEVGKDIRQTCRVKNAKGAKQVQFPVMGRGKMQKRTSNHTPIPLANVGTTLPTATVERYTISDMTDIFDQSETNYDERQELVKSFTMAMVRQLRQIVIDVLAVHSFAANKTVADNVSGATANMTLKALIRAGALLDLDEVPEDQRFMLIHTTGVHSLNTEAMVVSGDYTNKKPLVDGSLDQYYGFNFMKVGNAAEGGLPSPGANKRNNFAYHKMAVGLAVNLEPKIEVGYSYDYGAWRVNGFLSAGAVVIDPKGVIKITTDESGFLAP